MPKLRWLPSALDDLDRLANFIAVQHPNAAKTAVKRIRNAADQLEVFPEVGRRMKRDDDRRELVVPFASGAYVLRYRFDRGNDAVVVIRVWHSRELRY